MSDMAEAEKPSTDGRSRMEKKGGKTWQQTDKRSGKVNRKTDGARGMRSIKGKERAEAKQEKENTAAGRNQRKDGKCVQNPRGRAGLKSEGPAGSGTAGGSRKSCDFPAGQNCMHFRKCGSCKYLHMSYEEQLALKRKEVRRLMEKHCKVQPVIGMEDPFHYRHKVHAVFGMDRKKNPISGVYEEKSHRILPVESCLIEDERADEIVGTIRGLLKSFKIRVYDEDTGYGLLRYVLIRKGCFTGEIMVVLVTASPVFPSKRNFVEALRKVHPQITTVVQNVNNRTDSMILGDRYQTLYGRGFIEDELCGCRFKISPASFYQVNPVQAAKLYEKAVGLAELTGTETVVDAYCGTGTIGLIAAKRAGQVIGVESNPDAVKDAVSNAKSNGIRNIRFYRDDAGHFLKSCAEDGIRVDVVLMDPPRAGSTEEFLTAAAQIAPEKIVYVSCNPETMERDVSFLERMGYRAKEVWPVDMFPWTGSIECVTLLQKSNRKCASNVPKSELAPDLGECRDTERIE